MNLDSERANERVAESVGRYGRFILSTASDNNAACMIYLYSE